MPFFLHLTNKCFTESNQAHEGDMSFSIKYMIHIFVRTVLSSENAKHTKYKNNIYGNSCYFKVKCTFWITNWITVSEVIFSSHEQSRIGEVNFYIFVLTVVRFLITTYYSIIANSRFNNISYLHGATFITVSCFWNGDESQGFENRIIVFNSVRLVGDQTAE